VESKNLFRTRNSKRVARVTHDADARAMPPVLECAVLSRAANNVPTGDKSS